MNAVPAKVAGCARIAMVAPTPEGRLNPLVLAAARIAGVDEIYRVGGAQAIAALAYGTATIAPVAKIVGPGQRLCRRGQAPGVRRRRHRHDRRAVRGRRAGRRDRRPALRRRRSARAGRARRGGAVDPHHRRCAGSRGSSRRRSPSSLPSCRARRSRARAGATMARSSWSSVSPRPSPLVDRLAPEHLEIIAADAEALSAAIRNAGAIFLGAYTPEAIGDYVGGSNHVLPTSRSARFSSGLSVHGFRQAHLDPRLRRRRR